MSLTSRVVRRCVIPCGPSELSALLRVPVRTVRALLYQQRAKGRVERLERSVRVPSRRGRKTEYLWGRT